MKLYLLSHFWNIFVLCLEQYFWLLVYCLGDFYLFFVSSLYGFVRGMYGFFFDYWPLFCIGIFLSLQLCCDLITVLLELFFCAFVARYYDVEGNRLVFVGTAIRLLFSLLSIEYIGRAFNILGFIVFEPSFDVVLDVVGFDKTIAWLLLLLLLDRLCTLLFWSGWNIVYSF